MQITGGRGRKARDDLFAHGSDIGVLALTRWVLYAKDDDLIGGLINGVVDEIGKLRCHELANAFSRLSATDLGEQNNVSQACIDVSADTLSSARVAGTDVIGKLCDVLDCTQRET
jgi:hypothetical protein